MKDDTLTKRIISDNFDVNTIRRGRNYYAQNRVVRINNIRNNIYTSEVDGSYTYEQHITISNYNTVEGECSCPVGYNCKHIVASLYKILEIEENPKKNNPEHDIVKEWADNFVQIHQTVPTVENRPIEGDFLIFRLFEYHDYTMSDLEFYRTRYLKKGGLSKGSLVSRDNIFHSYQWQNYVSHDDQNIISKLKNLIDTSEYRYATPVYFNAEYGAMILKQLIATKKCYFKNHTEALVWSDNKKTITYIWEKVDEHYTLASNLPEEMYLIMSSIPMLCIDTKTNTLFELESSYSAKEIELFKKLPPITEKTVNNLTHSVLKDAPLSSFPIPPTYKIEELKTSPTPYLRLYSMKNVDKSIHLMQLVFSYDNMMINAYPVQDSTLILESNKNIKVIRDTQAESSCRNIIENLGFIYEAKTDAYLSFANTTMQEAIERWRQFITQVIPKLQAQGWQVEIDDNFNYEFEDIEVVNVESSTNNSWFELSFTVDIAGKSLALLPIVASLLEEYDSIDSLPEKLNLEFEEGKFLHIETKEIKPILQTIFELFDKKKGDKLKVHAYDAHLLEIDESRSLVWKGNNELKALSKKLKNFEGIAQIEPSPNLQATLRDYQRFGLNWLNFLHEFKFCGILADDMGLGKTIQTLVFLQYLKEAGKLSKPSLIIMPTSLIGNWKNEITKFTPNLSYLTLYGSDRAEKFDKINDYDILLTTYQLAQRDIKRYEDKTFDYIILDEAQKIKNPKTKMAIAIKSLNSEHKLALSGTPIENHLGELWSIFDFLMGGFLDTLKTFKTFYQIPIEQEHQISRQVLLNKKIAPFILRRTKEEVVKELPPKTEIIKKALLGNKQAKLYENIRITMETKVRETIKNKGASRSHITILDALLKLRQVCCHPQLLKLEAAKNVHDSAKLDLFLELTEELMLENRKVLVFSQFTSMLSIIEKEIKKLKISYTKLTGATRKREEVIEKFTKGNASIFLISLKAGGVGLNLVEADTIIHYDPWWNPAVENQATDRAYRIGQNKPVFVYKLIIENSIEEKILQLQEKKKSLQDGIYKEKNDNKNIFSGNELIDLLKL